MNFEELCNNRHSVRKYNKGDSLSDAELKKIFSLVQLSPSSFNIQHWSFVVVRDSNTKQQLKDLSYGQAQVADSAAVILVCGRLDAYLDADRIYADTPTDIQEKYIPLIDGSYRDHPALQRDEAIRSASMAAMSLMYAAKSVGWDSGPMIGFDAAKVAVKLEIDEHTIPVMMVVLGKALDGEQPARAYRRELSEVVKLETMRGNGLAS